jgi:hypothetical protein
MFFENPVVALKEVLRVLVPGAKVVCITWSSADRVPWGSVMAIALAAEAPHLASELLRPFSLSDPQTACGYLGDAGFANVDAKLVTRHGTYSSIEEYLRPFELGGGRLGQFYLGLKPEARARVNERVRAHLEPWLHEGSISLEAEAVMATAQAP